MAGTMICLFGATTGGIDWIEVHNLLVPLGTFAQTAPPSRIAVSSEKMVKTCGMA